MSASSNPFLSRARLVWGVLLMGQGVFAGVVAFLLSGGRFEPSGGPVEVYGPLAWAVLVVTLFAAVLLRSQESRRELGGQATPPGRWLTTRILIGALSEGPVILALCFLLLTGETHPFAAIAVIGFLFGAAQFPLVGPTAPDEA